jgi:hypothetical protein
MGFLIKIRGRRAIGGPEASAAQIRVTLWWLGICILAALLATGCASQPPVSDAPRRPMRIITDFQTLETPEVMAVLVKSDRPLTYTATRQEGPRGVLFQFPDTGLEGLDATYFPPPNPVIRAIRSAEASAGHETRVFADTGPQRMGEPGPAPGLPGQSPLGGGHRGASIEVIFHRAHGRGFPDHGRSSQPIESTERSVTCIFLILPPT